MEKSLLHLYYDHVTVTEKVDDSQEKGHCPFHEDKTPSFYINTETQQWYCFSCEDGEGKGGGPVSFVQRLYDVSEKVAQYAVDHYKENQRLPFPTLEHVTQHHEKLKSEPAVMEYLHAIGVTDETIDKFKIGWEGNRLMVPVKSQTGFYINFRKYMPPGSHRTAKTPKTINIKHLGQNRYYPYSAFDKDEVYLVEGDKDFLVSHSQGLNSVTSTGGKQIPANEIHLFYDKVVYLMLDDDKVGRRLINSYISILKPIAKKIILVKLPTKDIAEYYEQYGNVDIAGYCTEVNEVQTSSDSVTLRDSINVENMDASIELKNMRITGKHFGAYTVPKVLKVDCTNATCKKECPYRDNPLNLPIPEREIMGFLKTADTAAAKFVKKTISCNKANVEPEEYVNVQIIHFQEDLTSITLEEHFSQMQTGIYLFEEQSLDTNKTYDFKAIRTTDPKTQQIVFIILEATECNLDIDVDLKSLEYFREQAKGKEILPLLEEYYEKWIPNLEVFGRSDLFYMTLLTYLSAIGFYWGNTLVKGWLDVLVIGDTRTGKSKMAKNFMKSVGLGSYVSGENARMTGIVGGIQKVGDSWSLSWGMIPLNDKRICIVDEASGLSVNEITELSQMRSEGIINITKIISETTTARTRLFWVTNPRSGIPVDDYYWNGVDALREFLPVQEDLARFDVVLTAGINDVENTHLEHNIPMMSDSQLNLWRQLILFAWNLMPEDIEITKEMRKLIIEESEKLADTYQGVPLILKTNGYEKVARLAISLAILEFSYVNGKILVKKEHIYGATQVLKTCYNKKSFAFNEYSADVISKHSITEERVSKVKHLLGVYPNLSMVFSGQNVRSYHIQEILGIDKDDANKLTAELYTEGLISMSGAGYRATPPFLKLIRRYRNERETK